MPALFVTGATGFVGRALIDRIASSEDATATALVRGVRDAAPPAVRYVDGDILLDGDWPAALEDCDTVVHLAAATGRLSRDVIWRVNVEGTRRLLRAAANAGVRQFLFVSSIAARFADAPHYHYAQSKREAERLVAGSGLRTLIVRPTMVLGPGSPIGRRLRTLATAPVMVVFGSGRTRIQPVHIEDLASILLDLAVTGPYDGRVVEIGGPDVIGIEDFLGRVRTGAGRREGPRLHVPVAPLRSALSLVERVSVELVPFTAGQLASFTNDGIVAADARAGVTAHGVESIVAATVADV